MRVKVKVDRMVCVSLVACTVMSPTLFKIDPQGKAIVDPDLQKNNPQVHSLVQNEETDDNGNKNFVWEIDAEKDWIDKNVVPGAQACPITAIIVWDLDENKQLYPAA
jgi:ferredoxin